MTRRPPLTLWLHILWDLWRLILLTAAVLVTVIAFAAAVKPLADGKLGPVDTLRFMLLAMPPMLQYALPFAACFGATLAYHRLTADNEATAAYAGGISHRSLIFPALASGVVLALLLLVLSNRVIPAFLRQMSELVSQDISKFIVHQIKSGEAVPLGSDKRRFLFADEVVEQGADAETGAFQKLWLGGLLLVKLDRQGEVEEQASAREATVWLRRVNAASDDSETSAGPMTEVVIRPRDAVFQRNDKRGEVGQTIQPFLIPNSFTDDPKYLTDAELRALKDKPERIQDVDRRRRELAMTLAQFEAIEAIRESLRDASARVEFVDALGQRVVLKAGEIRARRLDVEDQTGGSAGTRRGPRDMSRYQVFPRQRGQPIVVERTLGDGTIQSQRANSAELRLPKPSSVAAASPVLGGGAGPQRASRSKVSMTLQLMEVSAQDMDENGELLAPVIDDSGAEIRAAPGIISEWTLSELSLVRDPAKDLMADGTYALLSAADERQRDRAVERDVIVRARDDLRRHVDDLMREVLSKQQERLAMSAACLVMVLIGATMALRLRDSLPLAVYLWAFFPALATVITISAGQRMTHGSGAAGLPLLWAGVAALGALGVVEFVKLVRH